MSCTLIVLDDEKVPLDSLVSSLQTSFHVHAILLITKRAAAHDRGHDRVHYVSLVPAPLHRVLAAALVLVRTEYVAWLPVGPGAWSVGLLSELQSAAPPAAGATLVPIGVRATDMSGAPVPCSPHAAMWPTVALRASGADAIFSSNHACASVFGALGGKWLDTNTCSVRVAR